MKVVEYGTCIFCHWVEHGFRGGFFGRGGLGGLDTLLLDKQNIKELKTLVNIIYGRNKGKLSRQVPCCSFYFMASIGSSSNEMVFNRPILRY